MCPKSLGHVWYLRGKSASGSDIYPGTGAMSRAASVLNGEGYAEAVK